MRGGSGGGQGGCLGGSLANTHHVRLPISKGIDGKEGGCWGVFVVFIVYISSTDSEHSRFELKASRCKKMGEGLKKMGETFNLEALKFHEKHA